MLFSIIVEMGHMVFDMNVCYALAKICQCDPNQHIDLSRYASKGSLHFSIHCMFGKY